MAVTFILTLIIGLGSGMALMYCISLVKRTRKFTVSVDESSHPLIQAIQPTVPAGPVYEEVSPKEDNESVDLHNQYKSTHTDNHHPPTNDQCVNQCISGCIERL